MPARGDDGFSWPSVAVLSKVLQHCDNLGFFEQGVILAMWRQRPDGEWSIDQLLTRSGIDRGRGNIFFLKHIMEDLCHAGLVRPVGDGYSLRREAFQ